MTDLTKTPYPTEERNRIVREGRLHWFHWAVLAFSLMLTMGAWYLAEREYEAKILARFEHETDRAVMLLKERMQKYEDALWAGVGAIHVSGGSVDQSGWKKFSNSLALGIKYPGINGIGVVLSVAPHELDDFLAEQRLSRPGFSVHPAHEETKYLPITYIEPLAPNINAIGLDLAHEENRYLGAQRARDSGDAQITGPIVLVQDKGHTPGFLFYAPYYRSSRAPGSETHPEEFVGLVYAPFVVRKLMAGTLAADRRYINLRISDGSEVIYDELDDPMAGADPKPVFKEEVTLPLYGRNWKIEFHASQSFRAAFEDNQSYMILIGGILLDALLLTLFLALTRANRRALSFADAATEQLRHEKVRLQRSNEELEQFAYIASHDLQEPLRMVGNFVQLLQNRYQSQLDETADTYIKYAVEGVTRMQTMLHELLAYSRVGSTEQKDEQVNLARVVKAAMDNLREAIADSGAVVTVEDLPEVVGDPTQFLQLFQNLISNGIKFSASKASPAISVRAYRSGKDFTFEIQDNGIGILPEYFDRIFTLFQRLHHRDEFLGNGIGLSICKKIVLRHGGRIWVQSVHGEGATFKFTLPASPPP